MMQISGINKFLFYPEMETSPTKQASSVITIIALSILTAGTFLLILGIIRLRNLHVKFQSADSASIKCFSNAHSTIANSVSNKPLHFGNDKVENLKKRHAEQLSDFEAWAAAGQWKKFSEAHYDWWIFPIDRKSQGHGLTYAVNKEDINHLKSDSAFMNRYRQGVKLVVKSWGWDLENNDLVSNPAPDQCWTGYGVRLGKMGDSLKLFEEKELFEKVKSFYTTICVPNTALEPWVKQVFTTSD